jgi:RNA polymerase sigma factor (sigma-70 family)
MRQSGAQGEAQLSLGNEFDAVFDAARAGAPWAFERIYGDMAPAVTGYARMQGSAEPEDVCNDVFMGVFAGLSSFSGSEKQFRSWVFTIAHRLLIDEGGGRWRKPTTPIADVEVFDHPGGDVEEDALNVLGKRRVYTLCAELSSDQREVLLLRVVADLTVEQVADVVGKSPGAIKALQRRGLAALRKKMLREGVSL